MLVCYSFGRLWMMFIRDGIHWSRILYSGKFLRENFLIFCESGAIHRNVFCKKLTLMKVTNWQDCKQDMPKSHTSFISNSVGIMDVAALMPAEKTPPNCRIPHVLVDVVASNPPFHHKLWISFIFLQTLAINWRSEVPVCKWDMKCWEHTPMNCPHTSACSQPPNLVPRWNTFRSECGAGLGRAAYTTKFFTKTLDLDFANISAIWCVG